MKTISVDQLRAILAEVKSATTISMVAVTDARCRKTDNPFAALGPVFKVCRVSGMVGTDHEAAVNRQGAREGVELAYEESARSWGDRVQPALIQKGPDWYLPIQLNPTAKVRPIYLAPHMVGTKLRLLPVMPDTIKPFLPPDRSAQYAAHQGVERPVLRRDYRLDSIATISILGEKYRVRA